MTSPYTPTQDAKQKEKPSQSRNFTFFSNLPLRVKLVLSFTFIAILGGLFTSTGTQIALSQTTSDALPSLQAVSRITTLTRSVQVETLSFISTGNEEQLKELNEYINQLNAATDDVLELADDPD